MLYGIPAYFCSVFRLPAWVTAAIDKIRRGFFWRGRILNSGFHCLVKWGSVCRPKRFGGLGVKHLHTVNSALLMKGLWNFYNSTGTLWVQIIRHKHHRLRPPSLSNSFPAGCSPIWKDMLRLVLPFFASVCFVLGNDEASPFWFARWCGEFALCNLFPNLFASARAKHLPVRGWLHYFSDNWDSAFTLPLSCVEHEELLLLRALVSNRLLSGASDSLLWRWNTSDLFSTRNAYLFLACSGVRDCKIPFIWKAKVPLRVKVFMWLAARNRILTADILARRGWPGPSICVFCSCSEENLEHLLFSCSFASALWQRLLARLPVGSGSANYTSRDLPTLWCSLRASLTGIARDGFDTCFVAACWELWKERNARLFNNKLSTAAELERKVLAEAEFWFTTLRDHGRQGG